MRSIEELEALAREKTQTVKDVLRSLFGVPKGLPSDAVDLCVDTIINVAVLEVAIAQHKAMLADKEG